MPKNSLKIRVEALCERHRSNLKEVCKELEIPYASCFVALQQDRIDYKNLPKIAAFFNVSLDWVRDGKMKDLNKKQGQVSYINRELIHFDTRLEHAFDTLDRVNDPSTRSAVAVVIEYYRHMELILTEIAEQVIDVEDVLRKNKTTYSKSGFLRMKSKIKELKKTKKISN